MADKAYMAGPMSGLPQFNFPAFFAATDVLRAKGWTIVSPAEIDNEEDKGKSLASPDGRPYAEFELNAKTWGDFLARDVKIIADQVEAIVFLPGWEGSKGANLEATVGLLAKRRFYVYENGDAHPVPRSYVQERLRVVNAE